MTTTAMLMKEIEALPEECVAEALESMFGAFSGISTYVERDEEDGVWINNGF